MFAATDENVTPLRCETGLCTLLMSFVSSSLFDNSIPLNCLDNDASYLRLSLLVSNNFCITALSSCFLFTTSKLRITPSRTKVPKVSFCSCSQLCGNKWVCKCLTLGRTRKSTMLTSSACYLQDVMVTYACGYGLSNLPTFYFVMNCTENDMRQFLTITRKDTHPDVLIRCRNIKKYLWMTALSFWLH